MWFQVCDETSADFDEVAREFLLRWNSITNVIIKELTLRSAETFGKQIIAHDNIALAGFSLTN